MLVTWETTNSVYIAFMERNRCVDSSRCGNKHLVKNQCSFLVRDKFLSDAINDETMKSKGSREFEYIDLNFLIIHEVVCDLNVRSKSISYTFCLQFYEGENINVHASWKEAQGGLNGEMIDFLFFSSNRIVEVCGSIGVNSRRSMQYVPHRPICIRDMSLLTGL